MTLHRQSSVVRTSAHTSRAHVLPSHPMEWMNLGLLMVAAAALVFYVFQANSVAAQSWRTRDAQSRLSALLDQRNSLVAEQASLDDRAQLTALAAQAGFVPAGAVVYLVENRPVAAR